jgi:flagellar secretion chaperone FliS
MEPMPRSALSGAAQYRKVGVQSTVDNATPHKLIDMLLEGAISKLHVARGLLEKGQIAAKGEQISWALAIVEGLRGSLDMNGGGAIAANLDALYDYMMRRLLIANLDNDPRVIDEVIGLLSEIREGWNAIC